MRLLHTADWHLGRPLYEKKRFAEAELFLRWLLDTIRERQVAALVVAGDVFDNGAPGNTAQELYYRFLADLKNTPCRHALVVAGNHDSPAFLHAPASVLRALSVQVVGQIARDPADDVFLWRDGDGKPEMLVAAVPYLRERDVRLSVAGENYDEQLQKFASGVAGRYAAVAAIAARQRADFGDDLPIVATGHLMVAGGQSVADGSHIHDWRVGTLAGLSADIFSPVFDYVALGHLHIPQTVARRATARYSGSPLPMTFAEAGQEKSVVLVEFTGRQAAAQKIAIPVFQPLKTVRGDFAEIARQIAECRDPTWVEVTYTGAAVLPNLAAQLRELTAGAPAEILRIKNRRPAAEPAVDETPPTLDDLSPVEVFARQLDAEKIPAAQREELRRCYQEILATIKKGGD
ncbi:MAG: exonuclease SbcCD subunit D C-terminal domain-containing protein [Planctomycetota bacterium]|jgi:exonuclease SbcD|nr:exonuclease SbcCD subunit D C-terminal domain-containing protein [Planctomycetota bacterium]